MIDALEMHPGAYEFETDKGAAAWRHIGNPSGE
jgi:hypothetical protein